MNVEFSPEQEAAQESLEDVSPSLKGGMKKPKEPKPKEKAADKAKDLGKEVGDKAVKKGAREMTKQAALAAGRAIASAFASIAGAIGWPYLAGCLVIFLIVLLIFGGLGCQAINGYFGKTIPQPAGKDDSSVKALLAASKAPAGGDISSGNYHKLDFLNQVDKEFVESGKIDKRLAAALNYLVGKHQRLAISYIIAVYKDMPTNPESGAGRNNISAHKDGLAADISQVDFIYKVDEEKEMCQDLVASLCGPAAPACKELAKQIKLGDLVYYSDKDNASSSSSSATLDPETINNKIDIQQEVLNEAQSSIDQSKQQIEDLRDRIESAKITLEIKQSDGSITTEQRASIQAQIQKIQNIVDQTNILVEKIDGFSQQIKSFNQKIVDLQQKLVQLKENLQKIQEVANLVGGDSEVNEIINNINTTIDKILIELDSVATQTTNLANMVADISNTLSTNVQSLVTVISQVSSNLDAYLNSVDQATGKFNVDVRTDSLDGIGNSLPDLDGFISTIENLIQETANAAIDQIKKELEEQLEKAVEDQLNKALGDLGLGFLGDSALLRLPCMGFVPPGATSGGDTGITDIGNLNLGGSISIGEGLFKVSFNIMDIIKKFIPEEMLVYAVIPNTKYKDNQYAQAVPIKIKWQDNKPDAVYINNEEDDRKFINPLIYYAVYQPEARRKTHQVITELLQFPYDQGNPDNYRVTQLITESQARDVTPFSAVLDKLYGADRPANFGLFSMPETWAQIHIGY